MNEPILAEEDWQRLGGETPSPPPNPRQVAPFRLRWGRGWHESRLSDL